MFSSGFRLPNNHQEAGDVRHRMRAARVSTSQLVPTDQSPISRSASIHTYSEIDRHYFDGNDQLIESICIRVYLYPKYRFTHPYQTK